MKVYFSNRFEKDYKKLPVEVKRLVISAIDDAKEAESLKDIFQCKLLRTKDVYAINVGNSYRIGLRKQGDKVTFICVNHRSEIYNRFP
jgi:mRNA-degrading endonuclease RelE of RelBE toxin-antitoxin system